MLDGTAGTPYRLQAVPDLSYPVLSVAPCLPAGLLAVITSTTVTALPAAGRSYRWTGQKPVFLAHWIFTTER